MKNKEHVLSLIAKLKSEAETPLENASILRLEKELFQAARVEVINESTQKFNGTTYRKMKTGLYQCPLGLHQAVWTYYNGEIPPGYEIHHIDVNPDNNEPDNLICVSRSEHMKIHQQLRKKKFICDNCGKEIFKSPSRYYAHHFCDERCEQSYWRKRGGYPRTQETRKCVICGKEFTCRKIRTTQTCSNSCAGKFRFIKRKQRKICEPPK